MVIADHERLQFVEDLFVIIASFVVAIVLSRAGMPVYISGLSLSFQYIGMFVSGMLFASLFTVGPATVVLASFSMQQSPFVVAMVGGLGAMAGDYFIYKFIRDRLSSDIRIFTRRWQWQHRGWVGKKLARSLLTILGALIIASPLPDELGIALMGVSKISKRFFLLLTFILNASGILVIGLIARSVS